MTTDNKIHTFGDNNINLQNITANDINIITGKEENPEVTAKKQEIASNIADLIKQRSARKLKKIIADLIKKLDLKHKEKEPHKINASIDDFDDIDFDELIDSIKFNNCILFIGPELSINEEGENIHLKHYQEEISSRKIIFDKDEGFFMPNSETKLINKMKRFYSGAFHEQNKIGSDILEKLAQIPFNLIISACPDDTLHKIFDEHNKKHNFIYYNEDEQKVEEPTKDKPMIYNFLGNSAKNGKFIFTFQQFHDYINQKQAIKIPVNIDAKISEAVQFLFIGFDFKKWYNRLALANFKFNEGAERITLENVKTSDMTKMFVEKQFNISYIDTNYNDFVDLLLQQTHNASLTISLTEIFIKNTLNALEKIRVKAIDTNKLEFLIEIENQINQIKEKFF